MFRSSAVALLMLTGCGQETPRRAASDAVVAGADNAGAAWPLLLQHCLASPSCDPMSDFGSGANEASGYAGSVAWHVRTEERVAEGGEDYGASIVAALYGQRGAGGEGGRPLSIDELPDNLGGRKAKRTTLAIEYRARSGTPEVYGLHFISPYLTGLADGIADARLEVVGQAGVVFAATARGMAPPPAIVFLASQDLRDEPAAQLLAALETGETLSVRLTGPDGRVVLRDTLYTDGYGVAVETAAGSLADPEIARPVAERCAGVSGESDAFWKTADVSPALRVCDPRLPEMRR